MSIQAQFDKDTLDMLPKIKMLIANAEKFEANQMTFKTLNMVNNCETPLEEMIQVEIDEFQDDLIAIFKHREWVK